MLLTFYSFFFFLLILHVSLYLIFIYSYCAHKISSRPEMIPPIWLLLHLWIALEQLYRQLSLQYPHHFRYRYPWWNRQNKMNVVSLNTHFLNLTFFPFTQHLYILFNQLFDFTRNDSKPIFRYPYNVIIALIFNMRQFLILTHVKNIGKAVRSLPPSKTVGFKF
jgi:hypothetical protein